MQKIVPAILTNDLADLKKKLNLLRGVSEWVQIDVADGVFVPNKTVAPQELIGELDGFQAEIHLMARNPESYAPACVKARARKVIFHLEAVSNPHKTLGNLKQYQFEKSIAVNPGTPAESLLPYLTDIDSVLLLSVNPGFQGREFIPSVLEKARNIKNANPGTVVGMDGGISMELLKAVFEAGADYAVVGSAIWKSADPIESLRMMNEMLK